MKEETGLEHTKVVEFRNMAAIRMLANKQEYRNDATKFDPKTVTMEDDEDDTEVGRIE